MKAILVGINGHKKVKIELTDEQEAELMALRKKLGVPEIADAIIAKSYTCSVCGKLITTEYVAADLNNNAYCSTKCFAGKRRLERHG